MTLNECLLDADRTPMIHIKTDPVSSNKTWTRIAFWVRKNTALTLAMMLACFLTYVFLRPTSPSSDKIFQSLRGRFDPALFRLPHQDKLRPTSSFEHLEADTFLDWSRVSNASTKVKGAFVVVAREEELYRLRATMLDVESHFNNRYSYPWVIIGPTLFSRHFRELITHTTNSPVSFGLAPSIEWQEPYWIDIRKAEDASKEMSRKDLSKGESMYWRRMTRYNMGFLAFHPLLKDLEFYWKVQPGSNYHCDIQHDPFERMKREKKKFSFALTMTENHEFVRGLDETVKEFIIHHKNMLQPVSKKYAGYFSNCMIYNNFMITSLDFLRSEEYNAFFDALDRAGGFFYQRWGDSLPQSIAVSLFLQAKDISYDDLNGYAHDSGAICPSNLKTFVDSKCTCNPYE
ncbi:nucleotide-diphospho-sugar transferase, partial [Thamnidium elegans]